MTNVRGNHLETVTLKVHLCPCLGTGEKETEARWVAWESHVSRAGPQITLFCSSFCYNVDEKKKKILVKTPVSVESAHFPHVRVGFLWDSGSSHIPEMCTCGWLVCLDCPRLSECGSGWPCEGSVSCVGFRYVISLKVTVPKNLSMMLGEELLY